MEKCLVILVVISLSLHTDAFDFPDSKPPKIEPPGKEHIVSAGGKLDLICSGEEPVTWKPPLDDVRVEFPDEYSEYPPTESVMSVSYDPDSVTPYGVRLELFNVSILDVGFYTCMFNNTEDISAPTILDMEKRGQASRIYVYVNDDESLFVPVDNVIVGTQYSTIVVPCRPSSPNVHVRLFNGPDEILVDRKLVNLSNRIVRFDKMKGFTIPDVEMSDTANMFVCLFEREGRNRTITFLLHLMAQTYSVPAPLIKDGGNDLQTEVGGVIDLQCIAPMLDNGVPIHISWEYPAEPQEENGQSKKVTISNTTTYIENKTKRAQSNFTLTHAQKADEGPYTCIVIDINGNRANRTVVIRVHESGYSYINISSPNKVHSVVEEKNKLKTPCFQCLIKAYPTPFITWYDNHEKEISLDQMNKYKIKTTRTTTSMCINYLSVKDSGAYRVQVSTNIKSESLNFTLDVKVKPLVSIEVPTFYMVNQPYRTKCEITSNPTSEVSWFFKECDTKEQCLSSAWNKIEEIYLEPSKSRDGYGQMSILNYAVNNSGQFKCQAKNAIGSDDQASMFYVTDIEDGYGVYNVPEKVAVNDNATLICGVSKLVNYTGVINWYKPHSMEPITQDNKEGYILTKEETNYSYLLKLNIPNIQKQFEGKYNCTAEEIMYDGSIEIHNKTIDLKVNDEIAPSIFSTNMNNTDYKVALGMPKINLQCVPSGIPTPELHWYKDNVPLVLSDKEQRIGFIQGDTILQIDYITEEDTGLYKCVVRNRIGEVSRFTNLYTENQPIKTSYIITIVVLGVIFLLLIFYLAYKVRKERKIRMELSLAGLLNFEKGATESLNPELGIDEQAELLPYDKKWEFPRDNLKLGRQLGSGAFGVVMKGMAYGILENEKSTTVAVKMVKKTADNTFIKALASELKIMVHLGKHLNVVNLLGACTKNVSKRELLVIVEYCRFGNLHNYLLRHRDMFIDQIDPMSDNIDPNIGSELINRAYSISSNRSVTKYSFRQISVSDEKDSGVGPSSPSCDTANTMVSMIPHGETNEGMVTSNGSTQPGWRSNYRGDYNYSKDAKPISTSDLLAWSFQVARGMEYLANRKVLHGDLAARNILLADDNIVKICDFGLAKSMYKSDNYKKKGDGPLPVKWMAIESIRDRVFSTQSDVWSYGIVLWELFSLARTPYTGMDADEKFYLRLVEGYRMDKPKFANKKIYQTMLECWRAKPIQRPSFSELAAKLGGLLEDSVRIHYIDLNDPYMDMNSKWMAELGNNDYLAMMSAPDYKNIASTDNHDYVNDPFGGPTKVNPLSPDDLDSEGYLCMSPAKNSVITTNVNIFDFPIPPHKLSKADLKDDKNVESNETIPMLKMGRLHSDGSTPTTPAVTQNHFLNPTYQSAFRRKSQTDPAESYVNMSSAQKDSGFVDIDDGDKKPPANSFSNPTYLSMNGNNIFNNKKSEMIVA